MNKESENYMTICTNFVAIFAEIEWTGDVFYVYFMCGGTTNILNELSFLCTPFQMGLCVYSGGDGIRCQTGLR